MLHTFFDTDPLQEKLKNTDLVFARAKKIIALRFLKNLEDVQNDEDKTHE